MNIYVETRNPITNPNQANNMNTSIDPENPEIQTSKKKPIILSKTSLSPLVGMDQGGSINLLGFRPTTTYSPAKLVEENSGLGGPDMLPVNEVGSHRSISLIKKESVRVITERLLGICQSDFCEGRESGKIFSKRGNDNDRSMGDAS